MEHKELEKCTIPRRCFLSMTLINSLRALKAFEDFPHDSAINHTVSNIGPGKPSPMKLAQQSGPPVAGKGSVSRKADKLPRVRPSPRLTVARGLVEGTGTAVAAGNDLGPGEDKLVRPPLARERTL
ncbi:hypothetical protein J6590_011092 [Homalodisca vitripennis]|nr:hypothetical protein J6590_011092 [Homalodisca vitripennis]